MDGQRLVFASEVGTKLDAANVRRAFRRVAAAAGLDAKEWTPRELWQSFVSLLSDGGVPIDQSSRARGAPRRGRFGPLGTVFSVR